MEKPKNSKESKGNRINGQSKGSASKDRSTSKKREQHLVDSGNKNQESDKKNESPSKKEETNDMRNDTLNQTDNKSEASSSIATNKNNDAPVQLPAHLFQGLETTNGGPTKTPFRATGLLNKSQLKLASYIKQNKDVTLAGTKRFTDKSGEYYLKNIQLQNSKLGHAFTKRLSLNNPQNLENCLNILKGNLGKLKRRSSKIVTLLPENSLTPIPMKENNATGTISSGVGKKDLKDAERTAVFIRRMEYATSMKRQMKMDKNLKNNVKKISMIQEWWKTMNKIIKLQKNIRGFLFRKKLMNNLEHQEKLLQFITEFDNIHSYHLYKQFMDNLKKKADYEHSKQMEKCEDFCEKMDNLEKLRDQKNFLDCFKKWKDETLKRRQDALNNLADKLNKILSDKINQKKKDAFDDLKDRIKQKNDALKDKIKKLKDKNGKKKLKDMINAHRLNKLLSDAKDKIDRRQKEDAFKKLKYLNDKQRLKDAFKKWKDTKDDYKKRAQYLDQLKKNKKDDLKKKAEEEKKKFTIVNGVNDFELINDKPNKNNNKPRPSQIFISNQNDINIPGKQTPGKEFSQTATNFSFMAPQRVDFNLGDPDSKLNKSDRNGIAKQLNDVDSFMNNKRMKEAFDKWKENAEKTGEQKNVLDLLKNKQKEKNAKEKKKKDDLVNAVQKVDDFMIERKNKDKKDAFDKIKQNDVELKKKNNIGDAVQKLDKFMNDRNKRDKKDAFDKLKQNDVELKKKNNIENAVQKVDDFMIERQNKDKKDAFDKIKQNDVELKKKNNIENAVQKLDDFMNDRNKRDKKDAFDKLKKNRDDLQKKDDIAKAVQKLDDFMIKKKKKNAFDNLKKNAGQSEGFRILDKLFNDNAKRKFFDELKKRANISKGADKLDKLMNNKLKQDALNRLKRNADSQKAMDKLDKLLNDKIKKNFLDNLRQNANKADAMNILDKVFNNNLKKQALDQLKKIADVSRGVDKLQKVMDNNLKKTTLDKLKKNDDMKKNTDNLEKLLTNKLKRKFLDKLKQNLNDKEKRNHDIAKAVDKLNKIFDIDPQRREFFEALKKKANIAKAGDRLNKLLEDKLKGDTFKDLKTMDFVNILDGITKERDEGRKNEMAKKLMDHLKKLLGNDLLRAAFNKWKSLQDEIKNKKNLLDQLSNKKIDKDKLKKAFDHWRNLTDKNKILNNTLSDNFKKNYLLGKTIKKVDNDQNLRKYFDRWKDNALNPEDDKRSKRVSNRRRLRKGRSKSRAKSKLNKMKNLLNKAFQTWKNNSSFLPRRNVLEKIKQNKAMGDLLNDPNKEDLLKKYKMKMVKVLSNIYQRHKNMPLKKYFDKWNRARNPNGKDNFLSNNSIVDSETFQPRYYNPKHNIHNQPNGSPSKKLNNLNKIIPEDQYSDTTSNNASDFDGTSLIETKKEIQKPRNYTSQSFFIDKKLGTTKNDLSFNTHTTKQLPMTMKGDFVSLVQENPKILTQKNARIQVTNATCQLDEIMDDENEEELNQEEFDQEINKLKNCDIGNNKILTKVIKNCDYDLYASRRPFRTKKSKWYSVSIPLNGNEAKWEFLNNIKGEKAKNNINKFELIQNETLAEKIVEEEEEIPTESRQPIRSEGNKIINTEYKLREINYSQFYRSPVRSPKPNEEDEEEKLASNRVIRRPEQRRPQRSFMDISRSGGRYERERPDRNRVSNNIIRSKGVVQLDPKYRSIDYDNGYADVDDSDEDYNRNNNYDYNKKKLFP